MSPATSSLAVCAYPRTPPDHNAVPGASSIAGAIQYRHLSIHMFEGNAGTTDSGFRA